MKPEEPTGIEFSSVDGMVTYRVLEADGSLGPEKLTGINTADPEVFVRCRARLHKTLGLKPPYNPYSRDR